MPNPSCNSSRFKKDEAVCEDEENASSILMHICACEHSYIHKHKHPLTQDSALHHLRMADRRLCYNPFKIILSPFLHFLWQKAYPLLYFCESALFLRSHYCMDQSNSGEYMAGGKKGRQGWNINRDTLSLRMIMDQRHFPVLKRLSFSQKCLSEFSLVFLPWLLNECVHPNTL